MKIIRITKKDENNVSILFEHNQTFVISKEVVFQNGLRKDDDISEDHFSFLQRENQKYLTKQSALNYLGRRPHSSNELRIKLFQKKFHADVINEVIEEFKQKKIINDYEFGVLYASERMNYKKYGINKIKADLFKKGLDNTTVQKVIADLKLEEDASEKAIVLAEKKYSALKKRGEGEVKIKQKVFAFLVSKGYEYDVASTAVNKVLKNEETNN
jgi:regulatory protein